MVIKYKNPLDPRTWDNAGTMVCKHGGYNLGDTEEEPDNYEDCIVLPLYLYDHSGITMSTSPFSCPWDSGQVGVIYAKKGSEGMDDKTLEACLESEVKEYDNYLTGNVWGYVIKDSAGNFLDSCWGFVGDEDYCKTAMEEAVKCCVNELREDVSKQQTLEVGNGIEELLYI